MEGTARVEQPLPLSSARNFVLLGTLVSLVFGCWRSPLPKEGAVPAAQAVGLSRPMTLLPPLERVHYRDAIVRIVSDVAACTGTLIADDRVLTAHHCVSARDAKGRVLPRNKAPEEVTVELGGDDLPWGEVPVRAIVAPDCGYTQGDGDIAILVLTRHLIGMPISSARIEAAPEKKDEAYAFGFGRCALSGGTIHRSPRKINEVCATEDDCHSEGIRAVFPGHFTAPASICPGDSGGPVYSSRGDLIGVISASVMDGDDSTQGDSVFTRLDVWPQLFSAAHEISLGASPGELPPYGDCRAPAAQAKRP